MWFSIYANGQRNMANKQTDIQYLSQYFACTRPEVPRSRGRSNKSNRWVSTIHVRIFASDLWNLTGQSTSCLIQAMWVQPGRAVLRGRHAPSQRSGLPLPPSPRNEIFVQCKWTSGMKNQWLGLCAGFQSKNAHLNTTDKIFQVTDPPFGYPCSPPLPQYTGARTAYEYIVYNRRN